jgi:hypothetical protein
MIAKYSILYAIGQMTKDSSITIPYSRVTVTGG